MRDGQGQFQLEFALSGDPEPILTEFGYAVDGDFGSPSPDVAHAAYDVFVDRLIPFTTDVYNLVACRMQLKQPEGVYENEWSEVQQGGQDGDSLPQNTSYLLRKRTGEPGRGSNGRSYWPGVPESYCDQAGRLTEPALDGINDALTALLDDFDGVALPSLVVNYGLRVNPLDPPPRIPTEDPPEDLGYIETLTCDPRVATQRRRMRR